MVLEKLLQNPVLDAATVRYVLRNDDRAIEKMARSSNLLPSLDEYGTAVMELRGMAEVTEREGVSMAVDFFVMPITRYIPGAFITPTMRFAWSQGLPYTLVGQVTRQIPNGEPFGGGDAFQRREAYLASGVLIADLMKFPPPIPENLWDEASPLEPRFHRVDPASYTALLDESRDTTVVGARPRLFGLIKGRGAHRSHLAAQIFLPVAFDEPFVTTLVFERWLAGSVDTALRELNENQGTPASASARETLLAALRDAAELRFPLFVDV